MLLNSMNSSCFIVKIFVCCFIFLTIFGCQGQNHSLVVDHPSEGEIFINGLSLENWFTVEPQMMDENTNLYFLNLSKQKYNLRIILSDDSIIDTFFVVESGESYFAIDLKTGELTGFKY